MRTWLLRDHKLVTAGPEEILYMPGFSRNFVPINKDFPFFYLLLMSRAICSIFLSTLFHAVASIYHHFPLTTTTTSSFYAELIAVMQNSFYSTMSQASERKGQKINLACFLLYFFSLEKKCYIMRVLLSYLFFSPVHVFQFISHTCKSIMAKCKWESQAFWCKTGLKMTSVFHGKGKSIRPVGKRRAGILIN